MATATNAAGGMPAAGAPIGTGMMAPTQAEITGSGLIKWGALMGLLGLALAIGGIFIALTAIPLGGIAVGSAAQSNAIYDTILVGVFSVLVGVLLAFLSFVLYITGFGSLRSADPRFRTPRVLGIIGLVGLLLICVFMGFYADSIFNALACSASDTTCQNNATALGTGIVVLAYLGGLVAFIGLIGTILGLYRFGTRYSSGITKVGAILYIIPFVAVLAPLLVLVGAMQIHSKLRKSATMAGAGPNFAQPPAA